MTQTDRIHRHLRDHGSITAWEAVSDYGILRLSARIYDLARAGVACDSEWIRKRNRYGEAVTFKRYRLRGKVEQGVLGLD